MRGASFLVAKILPVHSGPYAIGYTAYALFFGAGGLARRDRLREITRHRLSRLLEVESYLRIRVTKMFADPHLLLVLAQ